MMEFPSGSNRAGTAVWPRARSLYVPLLDRPRGPRLPSAVCPIRTGSSDRRLAYPLDRGPDTPLGALTFVDIMRASLGVGPCEYVLDVEGQKKERKGVPTCVTRQKLLAIYSRNEQKQKRAEVEEALDNVLVFVQHIRTRIEAYVSFGNESASYLDRENKSRPELAGFITEMAAIARSIDMTVADHRRAMQTPQYAAGLCGGIPHDTGGSRGRNAVEQCVALTAGAGGNR